eukprot:CAMPEP_0181358832 /NCGR_PEP_ID=MMETSP1106-20121128/5744_1 /TAXON_ID=81844 /ORGANISM="Mantoniella antarctica, Strain SL-175" /LENGTH=304 /DNA_ID=CAMNT_0023471867 /DNA_START=302 /DNA_END=1216 /DNA_ORIENTATION=-
MVQGFEAESRLKIPQNGLKERITKASRGDTPEAQNVTALLAAWNDFPAVSFATTAATSPAEGPGLDAGEVDEVHVKPIAVVMHGRISNAQEMRELYGLPPAALPAVAILSAMGLDVEEEADGGVMPPPPPAAPNVEGAQLILDLYGRRFEDKDGDPSDQPATALTACEGSFSFVLLDSERDAVLIARSAESDSHPLFWGTAPSNPEDDNGGADDWDDSLLLSSDLAALDGPCGGAATAFPRGAFYYCDNSVDVGAIQRLSMSVSRAKRRVQPLHKVNSSGQVCGLGFYTESGNDLAALAHKYLS